MTAVAIRLSAELRARWRAWLLLAVVAGLLGGLVLAVFAGARRGESALERLLVVSRPQDVTIAKGFVFQNAAAGEWLGSTTSRGTHGHVPNRDELHASLILAGAGNAPDRRRHDQPHRVVGVVVVNPVDDPVQPGADALLGLEVEDQPVHPVLGEGPEDVAGQHQPDHLSCRGLTASADGERDHDRRDEDQDRDHRMDARQPVEDVRVEHPRRGLQRICPPTVHGLECSAP